MNFQNTEQIESEGFSGFMTMRELFQDSSILPNAQGVYIVLFDYQKYPDFLIKGTGGFFKGKDPNVSIICVSEAFCSVL